MPSKLYKYFLTIVDHEQAGVLQARQLNRTRKVQMEMILIPSRELNCGNIKKRCPLENSCNCEGTIIVLLRRGDCEPGFLAKSAFIVL